MADTSLGYGVYTNDVSRAIGSSEVVDNNNGIMTIISEKGVVNKPIFISSQSTFTSIYGSEDIGQNKCVDSALRFLESGNGLWVNRIGGGFEYYNMFDFEFILSGDDASFSGDESFYTAKKITDSLYVNGVTSDDVDIKTIQTTDLAEDVNFRLYTKYPIDLTGFKVSIKEDESYEVNDVADDTDEYYFPTVQTFRYQLLDKDGFVYSGENFLFSLVDGTVDFATNQDIFVEEAFKRSAVFGAVFGKAITGIPTPTTTYTTSSVDVVNGCINPAYDYETFITTECDVFNPISFFFSNREAYPALIQIEGGYDGSYDTVGETHDGIKYTLTKHMDSMGQGRGDIFTIFDTYLVSNLAYQSIASNLKSNKSVLLPHNYSYSRDIVTMDWGEFSRNGRTVQLPDSPKLAQSLVFYYKTKISEPLFGAKSPLIKDYLSPVVTLKRTQEPSLLKYKINFSRSLSVGYTPMSGLTCSSDAVLRDIHVNMLIIYIITNSEQPLSLYIGDLNNTDTEANVRITMDQVLTPIKKFLDADYILEITRPTRDSIDIKVKILPSGSVKYITLTVYSYDSEEVMNSDFI